MMYLEECQKARLREAGIPAELPADHPLVQEWMKFESRRQFLALERLLQAQSKCINLLLLVGDKDDCSPMARIRQAMAAFDPGPVPLALEVLSRIEDSPVPRPVRFVFSHLFYLVGERMLR